MENKEYRNIYVFAEQREGQIQPVAYELIGKARDLAAVSGEKVVAMLLGQGVSDKAQQLIAMGADEVLVADCPELKEYLTEQYAQVVYQMIVENRPSIVLYGATTIGRDLAPRLAARLSVEAFRLSPITKTQPSGTVKGPSKFSRSCVSSLT